MQGNQFKVSGMEIHLGAHQFPNDDPLPRRVFDTDGAGDRVGIPEHGIAEHNPNAGKEIPHPDLQSPDGPVFRETCRKPRKGWFSGNDAMRIINQGSCTITIFLFERHSSIAVIAASESGNLQRGEIRRLCGGKALRIGTESPFNPAAQVKQGAVPGNRRTVIDMPQIARLSDLHQIDRMRRLQTKRSPILQKLHVHSSSRLSKK